MKLWQNQKENDQVLGPTYMLLISRFLQTYLDVCVCKKCAYGEYSSRTDYQNISKNLHGLHVKDTYNKA